MVYVDLATGNRINFLPNTQAGVRHPVSLFAASDALYIADFADIFGSSNGTIYKVSMTTTVPGAINVCIARIRRNGGVRRASSAFGVTEQRSTARQQQTAGTLRKLRKLRNAETQRGFVTLRRASRNPGSFFDFSCRSQRFSGFSALLSVPAGAVAGTSQNSRRAIDPRTTL